LLKLSRQPAHTPVTRLDAPDQQLKLALALGKAQGKSKKAKVKADAIQ
jgi:hypothetical protein